MAFDTSSLDDYVDVAQRIADFRDRHPEGRLRPLNPETPFEIREVNGTSRDGKQFTATFIVYVAAAYRDAEDPLPGIGMAWEVFPGRTPYTLGSELMNAETSAWGRAIVAALASDSKRAVASHEEMRNRAAEHDEPPAPAAGRRPRRPPERPPTGPVHTKTTGPDHERLRHGTVEPTPDHRPAARTKGPIPDQDNPWQKPPPNRGGPGTGKVGLIVTHFDRLGITDRSVRLGYTQSLTGHAVNSTSELSDNELTTLLKTLEKCKNQAALDQLAKQETST